MKGKKIGILIGVSAVVVAVGASVTVTQQNEYKLIRQFGKVDRVISSSGISFKIPFIESTQSLPKETLLYDLAASDVITKDKKTMISDSYVLWKISDPLKFAQTLNSSVESGESRINTAVYNATKNAISSMSQDQVITSRDGELSDMVMEAIGTNMDQYGIELLKFETKQLDLPDDNKEAVYERMISERDNIAATYKAEGNSEAKVIRNKTDKEVAIQISDAKKQAEILEAEGEQEYMKILAQAAILAKWKPVFEFIPIESRIEKFQDEYYDAIARCHVSGESTIFIEFMLSQIDRILEDISLHMNEENEQFSETVRKMLEIMEYDTPYTRKTLMEKLGLKSRDGFRRNYLQPALEMNLIQMTLPDKPNSRNQRYMKV